MKTHRTRISLMSGLAGLFLLYAEPLVAAEAPALRDANASAPAAAPKMYHPPTEGRAAAPDSGGLTEVAVRLFGALLLVVALFLGGAWFFKRSKFFSMVKPVEAHLKIAESKNLAARHSLHVVTYGRQRFLIADSPVGTQFLAQLDEPPADETNPDADNSGDTGEGSFAEKLKMMIDGPARPPARTSDLVRRFKSFFAKKA